MTTDLRNSPHATATDFDRWEAKARTMTDEQLAWSRRDAHEASEACAGHDAARSGRYADENMVYAAEMLRRERARR